MTQPPILKSPERRGGREDLAAAITKDGSRQTYYTFRLLADRERVQDAFRAYAYFRWLDDQLDCCTSTKTEKVALLERQHDLMRTCLRGEVPEKLSQEEQMLVDLICHEPDEQSGMQIYLRSMMGVMAFDVDRCGRCITQAELDEYTRLLSTAVTELMYSLFGHKEPPAWGETRYHAVCGAHVVHMLRDMREDMEIGYINIPCECLEEGRLALNAPEARPFREWVRGRVRLAREYFRVGRSYIAQAKNFRCRLAGFAYIARFEWMLRAIERDGYCLRLEYPERKGLPALLWMVWRVFSSSVRLPWTRAELGKQPPRLDP